MKKRWNFSMRTITLATAQAIVNRQADALGGSWRASTGAEEGWGIALFPYAELSDGREVSIRIWVHGAEAMLSAEATSQFEESTVEIWSWGEALIEAAVNALARGDYEVQDGYVEVGSGRKQIRLTRDTVIEAPPD